MLFMIPRIHIDIKKLAYFMYTTNKQSHECVTKIYGSKTGQNVASFHAMFQIMLISYYLYWILLFSQIECFC